MHKNKENHITSLIVQSRPEQHSAVLKQVQDKTGAETHSGNARQKFVALLETNNEQEILRAIDTIQAIDGVLSVTMVYHHVDSAEPESPLDPDNTSRQAPVEMQ